MPAINEKDEDDEINTKVVSSRDQEATQIVKNSEFPPIDTQMVKNSEFFPDD